MTVTPTVPRAASETPAAGGEVITTTPRSVLRRRAPLLAVVAVLLLGVIVVVAVRSTGRAADVRLAADNPAPDGSMALVQVLEQHGVTVIATDSLAQTQRALRGIDPSDATVLMADPQGLLTDDQRTALLELRTDVVAVEPDLYALSTLAPDVGLVGPFGGTFTADCDVEAVTKAGTVRAAGVGYRVDADDSGSGDATACLTKRNESGLVQIADDGTSLTLLGLGSALQNDTIADRGDAALALNLLGGHRTLIWYLSTYADLQQSDQPGPSLADLTPGWVTPLGVLLLLVGIAAGIWRGRRFGPIVVENLPVVVRASETMEGRARLYSRSRARLRALDALRIATVDRLARANGLPRTATVDEVIDAVAARTGRDRRLVAALLLDTVPGSDAELVRLSDELLQLEASTDPDPSQQNGQHG